jgi:cephalosporin-C deacetylase
MAQYDLPLRELEAYAPDLSVPEDLSAFWSATLEQARRHPLDVRWEESDTDLLCLQTWDVTYPGFDGEPVRGWLHVPAARDLETADGLPTVIQYHGYGGGRGLPHEAMLYAVAGYAHFVMDTRGQGGLWSVGETPDPHGAGPSHPGFLTRGVLDPQTYYYRRVFTDAVRAVEAARSHPLVDPARVVVAGGSQGGGIALAVAALLPDVAGVMSDVPFLSNFARAIAITDNEPYVELARFLALHRDKVDQVFRTLSYFDVAVLARLATAPALFSVGLTDPTCPPSTVYAAYNAYRAPKRMCVYPYNGHEGGQAFHQREQLRWLRETLAPRSSRATSG